MSDHYVYLLIDPRDDSIFYIGQGVGTRAADHIAEAQSWDEQGRPALEPRGTKSPEERRRKLTRILEIMSSQPPCSPRVDFLRTDLTQREADLVETVAIDVLGLDVLTNQVHGPAGTGRMRAPLYEKLAASTTKTITRPALAVPTAGVRGAFDKHGGMLEADPETALQNAETLWFVNEELRSLLDERGMTSQPILLIGLQSGRSLPRARGIVVGIWEIERCVYDGPKRRERRDGGYSESPGYKFVVRESPSDELLQLREELMWHRLVDAQGDKVQANPGHVGVNRFW